MSGLPEHMLAEKKLENIYKKKAGRLAVEKSAKICCT